MKNFINLLDTIMSDGYEYEDVSRGVICRQISSHNMNWKISDGFPILTTKKMFTRGIIEELLWFLRGETNVMPLNHVKCNIWNKDAYNYYKRIHKYATQFRINKGERPMTIDEFNVNVNVRNMLVTRNWFSTYIKDIKSENNNAGIIKTIGQQNWDMLLNYNLGDLGDVYGKQWRNFNGVDQVTTLIKNSYARRMNRGGLVTAWNPSELSTMALRPCHWAWELITEPTNITDQYTFTLKWYQRSVDTFLGLGYNITSYALLGLILEPLLGMKFNQLEASLSNVHIYGDHKDAVNTMRKRTPSQLPNVRLSEDANTKLVSVGKIFQKGKKTDSQMSIILTDVIKGLSYTNFIIDGYEPQGKITAEMIALK